MSIEAAIDKSEPASEIGQRIENLNKFFMEMLYNNICRSLFEQHKLLFSFLLTTRLQVTTGELSMTDYRFLLTGGISLEDPPPKPADWIPDRCWSEIFRMAKMCEDYAKVLEGFHRWFGRPGDLFDLGSKYCNWAQSPECFNFPILPCNNTIQCNTNDEGQQLHALIG